MASFTVELLRTHYARLTLEDALAERGLRVRLRRVGRHLVAVVPRGREREARRALAALAPGVVFQLVLGVGGKSLPV